MRDSQSMSQELHRLCAHVSWLLAAAPMSGLPMYTSEMAKFA
jgi:hypothetical protein